MKSHGIDMGRTLNTTMERVRVLNRFLGWADEHGYRPRVTPSVVELRWNDDFTRLWVDKTSGLIEQGFESLYHEHGPLVDEQNFAIYTDANPAARTLLEAIKHVTKTRLETL